MYTYKMKKIIFYTLTLLAFSATLGSCNYQEGYEAVNVNNKFSISVPAWMKKVDDLKPGADFQYANRYRNFYAIGTIDGKQKSLNETMADNLNVIRKSLKNPVVSDSTEITLGGLKGIRVEIYGKMSGENIYFSEVELEGPTTMFHLSVWTRGEDRKLHFKETINYILNSFKTI